MNYMMIRTDDMLNGDGLRVVLFCTSCHHYCKNCHNPETWDASNGCLFDEVAKESIFKELENDYISGLTLSGGDPLDDNNLDCILALCKDVKNKFPDKNIWLYSGYNWEEIFEQNINNKRRTIVELCDVFVDGVYIDELSDVKYHWAGSTNQKIIDVHKSLENKEIVTL